MSDAQQHDMPTTQAVGGLPICAEQPRQSLLVREGGARKRTLPLSERDGFSSEFQRRLVTDLQHSRSRRAYVIRTGEPGITNLAEIQRRTKLYVTTGNRDYLIDVARYAMAEYIEPSQVAIWPQAKRREATHAL